jgi:exodeoxyribonuclease VII large subunit
VEERLKQATLRRLDTQSQRLDAAVSRLGRPSSRLAQQRLALAASAQKLRFSAHLYLKLKTQHLQQQGMRLPEQIQQGLRYQHDRLDHAGVQLGLLDPMLVLQRGYAWVSSSDHAGRAVMRAQDLSVGQALQIHLSDGQVGVRVTDLQ